MEKLTKRPLNTQGKKREKNLQREDWVLFSMSRIFKIFIPAENLSKGVFINFLPGPSNKSSWTPQDRGILNMLGETTCIFSPAENEPGNYFAHPDGDRSKTDGNNQERRRILTLRAGGEKKGKSWHSREKQFWVKRQWKHKLPCMKPQAIRVPVVLWVDVPGHAAGHSHWWHGTEGIVHTSSDSHTHSGSSADTSYLKSLSDLLCCL